jgi:hypothetical protein
MDSHDAMDESTTEQYLSIIMNNFMVFELWL